MNEKRILKNRISSLRTEISFLFLISFISILAIELFLKYIPAKTELQYDLGLVYLRFCYSFATAIITYFIFIYLPLEQRKAASYLIVHNKTFELNREVRLLIECINKATGSVLVLGKSQELEFEDTLNKIDPHDELLSPFDGTGKFDNWFQYLRFKDEQIRKCIYEILMLNDVLRNDYRRTLTFILDLISQPFSFQGKELGNTNMLFASNEIYCLSKQSHTLDQIVKVKLLKYSIEYHEWSRREQEKEGA